MHILHFLLQYWWFYLISVKLPHNTFNLKQTKSTLYNKCTSNFFFPISMYFRGRSMCMKSGLIDWQVNCIVTILTSGGLESVFPFSLIEQSKTTSEMSYFIMMKDTRTVACCSWHAARSGSHIIIFLKTIKAWWYKSTFKTESQLFTHFLTINVRIIAQARRKLILCTAVFCEYVSFFVFQHDSWI